MLTFSVRMVTAAMPPAPYASKKWASSLPGRAPARAQEPRDNLTRPSAVTKQYAVRAGNTHRGR